SAAHLAWLALIRHVIVIGTMQLRPPKIANLGFNVVILKRKGTGIDRGAVFGVMCN
ncbi:MAG: hypothetical protein GX600_09065, partial [Dehalococcoidia bacterium]|nr:hypothetical protein [Dehalococcoidia bacterium]